MMAIRFLPLYSALVTGALLAGQTALASDPKELRSIMFSRTDIANLTRVLEALDNEDENALAAFNVNQQQQQDDAELLEEIRRRELAEERARLAAMVLPDFYVSTILYRSRNDWTVWMRQYSFDRQQVSSNDSEKPEEKLVGKASQMLVFTPKKRVDESKQVEVISVSKDRLVLSYKPAVGTVAKRRFEDRKRISPRLEPLIHRASYDAIRYDGQANMFRVSLKANQTLSLNMMRVIEGRVNSNVTASNAQGEQAQGQSTENAPFVQGNSLEANAANQLMDNLQKLQELQDFLPLGPELEP